MEEKQLKKTITKLYGLLDDIDTASDIFKPRDLKSYEKYYKYVSKKHKERFKIISSDGYNLIDTETKESITSNKKDKSPMKYNIG